MIREKLSDFMSGVLICFLVLYACLFFWICRLAGIHIEEDF